MEMTFLFQVFSPTPLEFCKFFTGVGTVRVPVLQGVQLHKRIKLIQFKSVPAKLMVMVVDTHKLETSKVFVCLF